MSFAPSSRPTCKSQIYFVKILRISVLIVRKTHEKTQLENTGERMELFLKDDLELPAAFKGSLREGV